MFGIYLLIVVLIVLGLIFLSGIRFIPNNRVGIVEKRFSGKGSIRTGFIALKGEAGYQPDVLRGGLHLLMPIQYRVHLAPLVTIPQGKIGYVFARDGQPLEAMQVLASNITANDFQDVAGFLSSGGQRGPQRRILRKGTYAINLAQFVVITEEGVYCLPLSRQEDGIIRGMANIITTGPVCLSAVSDTPRRTKLGKDALLVRPGDRFRPAASLQPRLDAVHVELHGPRADV